MISPRLYIVILLIGLRVDFLAAQVKPEWNYIKARTFIVRQEYDSALIYLERSLKVNENNKNALLNKAAVLYEKREFNRSLETIKDLEKTDKAIGSFLSARSYAALNDIDNCLASLRIHLASNYKNPESEIMLDKAFAVFENDPKWISFWKEGNWYTSFERTLADADFLLRMKRYTDALDLLSESLTKGYRRSLLYAKRAQAYIGLNNTRLALSDLDFAIEGDSRNPDLYEKRAGLLFNTGNYRKSLEDYNTAVKLSPADPDLYLDRSKAESMNGLYAEAIDDVSFYLDLFPENDTAWYIKGTIYHQNNSYMDAMSCFSKAIVLNPAHAGYYAARGASYLNARTFRYAWRDLSMSLDLDPNNGEVYLNKGIAAVNLGDNSDACFCFTRARDLGNLKADSYIEKHCK